MYIVLTFCSDRSESPRESAEGVDSLLFCRYCTSGSQAGLSDKMSRVFHGRIICWGQIYVTGYVNMTKDYFKRLGVIRILKSCGRFVICSDRLWSRSITVCTGSHSTLTAMFSYRCSCKLRCFFRISALSWQMTTYNWINNWAMTVRLRCAVFQSSHCFRQGGD